LFGRRCSDREPFAGAPSLLSAIIVATILPKRARWSGDLENANKNPIETHCAARRTRDNTCCRRRSVLLLGFPDYSGSCANDLGQCNDVDPARLGSREGVGGTVISNARTAAAGKASGLELDDRQAQAQEADLRREGSVAKGSARIGGGGRAKPERCRRSPQAAP